MAYRVAFGDVVAARRRGRHLINANHLAIRADAGRGTDFDPAGPLGKGSGPARCCLGWEGGLGGAGDPECGGAADGEEEGGEAGEKRGKEGMHGLSFELGCSEREGGGEVW